MNFLRFDLEKTEKLPSQNSVTSARLSDLKRLLKEVARLLPKLFHFRQNCCCWDSISQPVRIMLLAETKVMFNYINE